MAVDLTDPYGSTIARIRDALDDLFGAVRDDPLGVAISVQEHANLIAIEEFVRRLDNA